MTLGCHGNLQMFLKRKDTEKMDLDLGEMVVRMGACPCTGSSISMDEAQGSVEITQVSQGPVFKCILPCLTVQPHVLSGQDLAN